MKYSLTCASLLAAQAIAHPFVIPARSSSSSSGLVHRNSAIERYRPLPSGEYVGHKNIQSRAETTAVTGDYLKTALSFAKKQAPKSEFRVASHRTGSAGVSHVYLKQTHNGIDIMNADMNINIAKDGSVLSFGNSFTDAELPSERLDTAKLAAPTAAFHTVREKLGLRVAASAVMSSKISDRKFNLHSVTGAHDTPTAEQFYYKTSSGSIRPVWSVSVDMWTDYYRAVVDAETGAEMLEAINYTKDASLKVYPWKTMDPTEGEQEVIENPWDKTASEFTWFGDGSTTYHTTRGNNIAAQTNWNGTNDWQNGFRPTANDDEFVYDYDPEESDFHKYGSASVTQLFYTTNMYHDLLYDLGFDEAAGNFENNNGDEGGKGTDFAICNAQDASGIDNAAFSTPPDGKNGRMWMYMWDTATPQRDGAFDAAIVIHEYTHGLSNRLTGGAANSDCLNTLEAGGMGEGWGDSMANAIRIKPEDDRSLVVAMSAWAFNNQSGIRQYPYATNQGVDPWTYGDANQQGEVHDVGEIWATVLYELLWNLIDEYPINDDFRPTFDGEVPTTGQFLYMKLVMDGMALQPCNPTFISARDAILDADEALTSSKNKCLIWKAFAKRGVGEGASSQSTTNKISVTESFDLPTDCQ
jgi:extracellular elastinolytic metalloproteinase